MNKLEQLSKKKFAGNLYKTFDYLFNECSHEMQLEYTKDITPNQVNEYTKYLAILAEKKGMDLKKVVQEEYDLASMSLSKEEVIRMETNPFKAKIGRDLLKFIVLNSGIASLYLVVSQFDNTISSGIISTALGFAALLNTSFSFDTVKDILNFCKFKKIKQSYHNSIQYDKYNDGPGRSK